MPEPARVGPDATVVTAELPRAHDLAAPALLQLQRTAGNRAVTRAVIARTFPGGKYPTPGNFASTFAKELEGLAFKSKNDIYQALKNDPDKEYDDKLIREEIAKRRQSMPAAQAAKWVPPDALEAKVWPPMARMEYPDWSRIEPLLESYGIPPSATEDREKIRQTLEGIVKNTTPAPLRGITDLIDRALGFEAHKRAVQHIKDSNTAAAPVLGAQTISFARGDTRSPHEIEDAGGLFGWNRGIVSIAHARQLVRMVMQMSPKDQVEWARGWKAKTPDSSEANPWVAGGTGKAGGQKAGHEYLAKLPLLFPDAAELPGMQVGTDTGNVDNANVIGVRLNPKGTVGDEVIVLTGIPLKYITAWEGPAGGERKKMSVADGARLTRPKTAVV
jgi:hypothetical protein